MVTSTDAAPDRIWSTGLLPVIEDVEVTITGTALPVSDLLTFLRKANDAAETIVKELGDAAAVSEIEVLDDSRVELVVRLYVA